MDRLAKKGQSGRAFWRKTVAVAVAAFAEAG